MNWKRKVYSWHRSIAYWVALPVFLWSISGIMHPFMSNWFKPQIANRFLMPDQFSKDDISIELNKVLEINKIDSIRRYTLDKVGGKVYYKVEIRFDSVEYFSAANGQRIDKLDSINAIELARGFSDFNETPISKMEIIRDYNIDYREINRLLPVWKVSFDDDAGTDVYVHTYSGRLASFSSAIKNIHGRIFNWFHNWGFLPEGKVRTIVVGLFSILLAFTGFLGIVIYAFSKKRKGSVKGNPRVMHRRIGIIFSLFVLSFSFSGGYHVWMKWEEDDRLAYYDQSLIPVEAIPELLPVWFEDSTSIIIQPNAFLLNHSAMHSWSISKGRKKESFVYNNYELLDFDSTQKAYAIELGKRFSGFEQVDSIRTITKFKGEYGFVNKRLPVEKVAFHGEGTPTFYIETSTGKLAAVVNDSDRAEGYSFAILHKHHFLDGLGRNARDIFSMLTALSLCVVVWFGLKTLRKKKAKTP
jgi:hypothetical protein